MQVPRRVRCNLDNPWIPQWIMQNSIGIYSCQFRPITALMRGSTMCSSTHVTPYSTRFVHVMFSFFIPVTQAPRTRHPGFSFRSVRVTLLRSDIMWRDGYDAADFRRAQ